MKKQTAKRITNMNLLKNLAIRGIVTLMMLSPAALFAENIFTADGDTVRTGYWNTSSTGGTLSCRVPDDVGTIDYAELYMRVNSGSDVQLRIVSDISGGVTFSESFTEAELQSTAAFSDGDEFVISVRFFDFPNPAIVDSFDVEHVWVDETPPVTFDVLDISPRGGTEFDGFWNSSNDSLTVQVDLPADATLLNGGTVQLKGFVGGNTAEAMGTRRDITVAGDTMLVTILAADVESIAGFTSPNAELSVTAELIDAAGNGVTGNVSDETTAIDQNEPTISSVISTTSNGTHGIDDEINVTLVFSELVNLTGGDLLTSLSSGKVMTTSAGFSEDTLSLTYTIEPGDSATGLRIDDLELSSGAAKLLDAAGNSANISTISSNLTPGSSINVDGDYPTITGVTTTTPNDTYGIGDTIEITIEFSELVTMPSGNFNVDLNSSVGDNFYFSTISNVSSATKNYVVTASDDITGLTVREFSYSDASLEDLAGNALNPILPAGNNLGDNSSINLDGIVPVQQTVSTITVTGGNVEATYWNETNEAMSILVPLASDNSLVGGTIQLVGFYTNIDVADELGDAFTIGGGNIGQNVSMSLTEAQLEDTGMSSFPDESVLKISAVVTDAAGNNTNWVESANTFTIDQDIPEVSSITTSKADGTYGIDSTIAITITFDQSVTLSGGNLIAYLNSGKALAISSISGLSVTEDYVVSADEMADQLTVDSLVLSTSGTRLKDIAGNNADLSTISSNLAASSDITIDASVPTITSFTSITDDGPHAKGEEVAIRIDFDKEVYLSDGDTLFLGLDATSSGRDLFILSAALDGVDNATGTYTVGTGADSRDLVVESWGLSDGGTLLDVAGNPVPAGLGTATNMATNDIDVDGIVPEAFGILSAVTGGDQSYPSYWNSSNTGITVTVPISATDESLEDGFVQIVGKIAGGQFYNLEAPTQILFIDTTIPVDIDNTTLYSNIVGFDGTTGGENNDLTFGAILYDEAGNQQSSTPGTNPVLHVDRISPLVESITTDKDEDSYGLDETIDISINFDENVDLTSGTFDIYLNTETPRTLSVENALVNDQSEITATFVTEVGDDASPLNVLNLESTNLKDLAGNFVDLSIAAGDSLSETTELTIYTTAPHITNIDSEQENGLYMQGDEITITIDFDQPVSLGDADTLYVNLNTTESDIVSIVADSISNTTQARAHYIVGDDDYALALNVASITLNTEGAGGTLTNSVDTPTSLAVPASNNLIHNKTSIYVDGIVPEVFVTGDIVTLDDSIRTGYWNSTNDSLQVNLPILGDDVSLDGGFAQLEARIVGNPAGYRALGHTRAIGIIDVPMNITRDELVANVPGFADGGVLEVRGVVTDIAGNSSNYDPSVVTLMIDQTAPTVHITGSISLSGGDSFPGYLNPTNTSIGVNNSIADESSLEGGTLRLQLKTGFDDTFTDIAADSAIDLADLGQVMLSVFDISDLTAMGVADGDTLQFRARVTDIAGNATDGNPGTNTMIVDFNPPPDFTLGSVLAEEGTVVAGYFNATNNYVGITVPIDEDQSLVGGWVQLRAYINAGPAVNFLVGQGISDTDDMLLMPDEAALSALGYVDGDLLSFDAVMYDVAGNSTTGSISLDQLRIDETPPVSNTALTVQPQGGNEVSTYWNDTNTSMLFTVPLENDVSLTDGYLQVSADLTPGDGLFETFSIRDTITALTGEWSIVIPADTLEELQGGTGFVDGLDIEFRTIVTDQAGNAVTSITNPVTLQIDQTDPANTEVSDLELFPAGLAAGVWSAGADSVHVTIPYNSASDASLVGGYAQLLMSMGETDDENAYELALAAQFPISHSADTTINLSETVISSFDNYDDGNSIFFKILLRDRAGNEITSDVSTETLYIDVNSPDPFDCGLFTALEGTIIDTSYNLTNQGVSLVVPIAADSSLLNGFVTFMVGVDDPGVDAGSVTYEVMYASEIGFIDTTKILPLTEIQVLGLLGYEDGKAIYATARIADYAGNEIDGTPSENVITIDLTPPDVPVLNDFTPVGGVVVADYWNASNTGYQFNVPTAALPGEDPSLVGGYVQAQARVGIEPFSNVGDSVDIESANFTSVLVDIPGNALRNLAGYGESLQIDFRANIHDGHGNMTQGTVFDDLLTIDETPPEPAPLVIAGIMQDEVLVSESYWGVNSDSIEVHTDVGSESSIVGGQAYLVMAIADEDTAIVSEKATISFEGELIVLYAPRAAVEGLASYADGELIHVFTVIQDVAGNKTLSVEADEPILIDISAPIDFAADSLQAVTGVIVDNAYNMTNSGLTLEIPIANDTTLIGGTASLLIDIVNTGTDLGLLAYEEQMTVTITDVDTTLTVSLDGVQVAGIDEFGEGSLIYATASLTDVAGNTTNGTASDNVLIIDLTPPDNPVVFDSTTVGEPLSAGYWNASNTAFEFNVLTPATSEGDTTLLEGTVQAQAKIGLQSFVNIGEPVSITSPNDADLLMSFERDEVILLEDYADDMAIDLRVIITDGHGNTTEGLTIDSILYIDETAPGIGEFDAEYTTTDPFISAEDTLKALWTGFSDAASGIDHYEFSVGQTAGLSDVVEWVIVDTNMVATLLTYDHELSYFMNVRAVDLAGNTSDAITSTEIIGDRIEPLSSIQVNPFYRIEEWDSVNSFAGGATDELSGIDSMNLAISRSSDGYFWTGNSWGLADTNLNQAVLDTSWSFGILVDSLENRVNYTLRTIAVDSAGNRQSTATIDSFQFVINTTPLITAISDTSSDEDSLFTYMLIGTDADVGSISEDTLSYFLISGPDSMLVDSASGLLTWTPRNADVGEHTIEVEVRDYYGASDTTNFVLEALQVNDPPEPVTLLLPADSTELVPEDSLLLTFSWTEAFDIEGDGLTYEVTFQGSDYDTTVASETNNVTLDVSVMDFPITPVEWFVVALDTTDTSEVSESFHLTTSPPVALVVNDSLSINLERLTTTDTTFTMKNLGLTDLRWSLISAPDWITTTLEQGVIAYNDSSDIALNIDPESFTIGQYGGYLYLGTNDPMQDTIALAVTVGMFDIPAPILTFYKNPAYPRYYEMMIVDSLGMVDSLSLTHAGDALEITEIDTFSYVATIEVASEGRNSFVLYASNWVGDTTITSEITVSVAKQGSSWLARSPDDLFEVSGGSSSVNSSSRVTVLDTILSATDQARYKVLTDGVRLAEPVLVSMPQQSSDQAIYTMDEAGAYYELPSMTDGERVHAWSETMGAFKMGPRTIIVPEKSELSQNYPNPFNPTTTIDFDIGFLDGLNQEIEFRVYNIRGQEVRTLMQTHLQPGSYSVVWNGLNDQGKQVSSGIYFARLMTGKGYVRTVKMLVLR